MITLDAACLDEAKASDGLERLGTGFRILDSNAQSCAKQ
jgi:hypothetical protein